MDRADEWPPLDELPDSTKRWSLFCGQLIEAIEQKNRKLRAANRLADACRNSGDESVQAALLEFNRVKGE